MNRIQEHLISLGICNPERIREFYPRVRDREDVRVLQCEKSGVIFLDSSEHVRQGYYESRNAHEYWSAADRKQALQSCQEDDRRRADQFSAFIRDRKWLDIGTGVGGILDLLASTAGQTCAVEPQEGIRDELSRCGYRVYSNLKEVPDNDFGVVTLFHVFEHLPEPLETLISIRDKMTAGSSLILEVPHARDALISLLDLDAFKSFTFWSEHLILHTRQSLAAFLRKAGFTKIEITGFQRYPLSNHLYWLRHGKPGGHEKWSFLNNSELNKEYYSTLERIDATDTLIAIAEKLT